MKINAIPELKVRKNIIVGHETSYVNCDSGDDVILPGSRKSTLVGHETSHNEWHYSPHYLRKSCS